MPRVSVVTPCYNGSRYLGDCVASVKSQTLQDWEMVIVDDGSTDDTPDMADRLAANDDRVRVIHQANRGAAAARNAGVTASSAPYLLFLDSDDALAPAMLERTVSYLDAHPEVAIVHTGHSYIGPCGEDEGVESGGWPWARYAPTRWWAKPLPQSEPETTFAALFLVAVFLTSLALVRRSNFEQTSGWDEDFGQGCEDTDLWLAIALTGRIHLLPEPLVFYRRHPEQWTTSPGAFERQFRKLHDKWADLDLSAEEARVVAEARWFREHRFIPERKMTDAVRLARQGKVLRASRAAVGAARAYRPQKPPRSTLPSTEPTSITRRA
jgi:glycosyltransferase involved in cell wall biosynthesis